MSVLKPGKLQDVYLPLICYGWLMTSIGHMTQHRCFVLKEFIYLHFGGQLAQMRFVRPRPPSDGTYDVLLPTCPSYLPFPPFYAVTQALRYFASTIPTKCPRNTHCLTFCAFFAQSTYYEPILLTKWLECNRVSSHTRSHLIKLHSFCKLY
jgi:hypothetical protein